MTHFLLGQEDIQPSLDVLAIAVAIFVVVFVLVSFISSLLVMRPWLKAFLSGCRVSLIDVVGMRLRGSNPNLIIDTLIAFQHRSDPQPTKHVESCYLAYREEIHDMTSFIRVYEKKYLASLPPKKT